VRVPERLTLYPLSVLDELHVGWQAGTRVIEVDVAASVEVGVFSLSEPVKQRGALVAGIRGQEARRR